MASPLAYHITWTAYGTWLHGDERGWVEKGTPCIMAPDSTRVQMARERMTEPPVLFDELQRALIEAVVVKHCVVRGWTLHARSVRSNHVHLVVTAGVAPETVMDQLKAWCSRKLSDQAGLAAPQTATKAGRRKWFTEHGSTKWINDHDYLRNAIRYVNNQ